MSTTAPAGVQTIDDMAAEKMFDRAFLEQHGVSGTKAGVGFDYLDFDGAPLYTKTRFKAEGGKNRFTVPPGTKLASYGRWRLADNKTGRLFITEGETDCLTLWHHGHHALGLPGASSTGCLCHEDLAGLDELSTVFVAPDNDTAGARFAEDAVARIRKLGFAGRVCVVRLPENIKDLNELHVQDSEGFKDALNVMMEESVKACLPKDGKPRQAEWSMEVVPFSEIKERPIDWLWHGRIPFGMLAVIEGPPKQGKTTIMFDVMSRLTTGREMPFSGGSAVGKAPCLLIAPEDPAEQVIKPRLMANGSDMQLVHHLKGFTRMHEGRKKHRRFILTDEDMQALENLIKLEGYKLVFFDAVMGILPDRTDSNSDSGVRSILQPLAELADSTGASLVIGRHWAKGATSRAAYERGLGSMAFTGVARSVLQVAFHPDDKDLRLLAVGAYNTLGEQPTLGYRIKGVEVDGADGRAILTSKIDWEGVVEIDIEEIGRLKTVDTQSSTDDCQAWLVNRLEELGGDATSIQIQSEAETKGWDLNHLKRAKKVLKELEKVKSVKVADCWRVRQWDYEAMKTALSVFG